MLCIHVIIKWIIQFLCLKTQLRMPQHPHTPLDHPQCSKPLIFCNYTPLLACYLSSLNILIHSLLEVQKPGPLSGRCHCPPQCAVRIGVLAGFLLSLWFGLSLFHIQGQNLGLCHSFHLVPRCRTKAHPRDSQTLSEVPHITVEPLLGQKLQNL